MMQYIHDVCAAYTGRVIKPCVVESAGLQVDDAIVGMLLHVFFGAENNGTGWTGFDAGGLLPDTDPVGAQGTFIDFVVFLGNAWDVEGAACNAITAAYAVFLMEIDNAVVVLDDSTRRWT